MPTPPLPVLHALLAPLSLPRDSLPQSLKAVSPRLLLALLEALTGTRLSLPPSLRHPRSFDESTGLAKCILGTLADDILGGSIDLSPVDPERVAAGDEVHIAVVVMALAVVARRRGMDVKLPEEEDDWTLQEESTELLDDEEGSRWIKEQPMLPDFSLSPTSEQFAFAEWPRHQPSPPPVHRRHRPGSHTSRSSISRAEGSFEIPADSYATPPRASPRQRASPLAFAEQRRSPPLAASFYPLPTSRTPTPPPLPRSQHDDCFRNIDYLSASSQRSPLREPEHPAEEREQAALRTLAAPHTPPHTSTKPSSTASLASLSPSSPGTVGSVGLGVRNILGASPLAAKHVRSGSTASGISGVSEGRKTVLQGMMEEFGLEPG